MPWMRTKSRKHQQYVHILLFNFTVFSLFVYQRKSHNIFDELPALAAPKWSELHNELNSYLTTDLEYVVDVLAWWTERKAMYPQLSQMALDYLSIPGEFFFEPRVCQQLISLLNVATSVDVEQIFSHGRLLLSHVRSRLSAQSVHALLCLGSWSLLGLVKGQDVMAVAVMPEVVGKENGVWGKTEQLNIMLDCQASHLRCDV